MDASLFVVIVRERPSSAQLAAAGSRFDAAACRKSFFHAYGDQVQLRCFVSHSLFFHGLFLLCVGCFYSMSVPGWRYALTQSTRMPRCSPPADRHISTMPVLCPVRWSRCSSASMRISSAPGSCRPTHRPGLPEAYTRTRPSSR